MKKPIILPLLIFWFLFSCETQNPEDEDSKNKYIAFCGTHSGNADCSPKAMKGKTLFLDYCASCHNNDMVSDMTGPALKDVVEKWEKTPNDLYLWIQNSQELVDKKHRQALRLKDGYPDFFNHYFTELDAEDIDCIFAYVGSKIQFHCR